jgi:copper ion binding protein
MELIIQFIRETAIFFDEMAVYLVFGFLVAGLIHIFMPEHTVLKHLGKDNWSSVIKSSLAGIPLPLCSCGVIPVAASLRKKGASRGAVLSFLISTPQIGADSFMITYSMIGWVFGLFRIAAAFVTAMMAGLITNLLTRSDPDEDGFMDSSNAPTNGLIRDRFRSFLPYVQYELFGSLAKYLIIGILIGSAIAAFVPTDFFGGYFQNPHLIMLLMLAAAVPMYVCATASTPIAAALLMKGISPGAALVFLLAGPATNAVAISAVVKALGRKTAVIYVVSISLISLLLGYALNIVAVNTALPIMRDHVHEMLPRWLHWLGTASLFAMFLIHYFRKYFFKKAAEFHMSDKILNVQGMTCQHCASNVKQAVESIEGTSEVRVDLKKGKVIFDYDDSDLSRIKTAIENKGYQVS